MSEMPGRPASILVIYADAAPVTVQLSLADWRMAWRAVAKDGGDAFGGTADKTEAMFLAVHNALRRDPTTPDYEAWLTLVVGVEETTPDPTRAATGGGS